MSCSVCVHSHTLCVLVYVCVCVLIQLVVFIYSLSLCVPVQVGALENVVYELEEAYLRNKAMRASRRQRARQRLQAKKEQQNPPKTTSSTPSPSPPLVQPARPGPQDLPSAQAETMEAAPGSGGPDSVNSSQSPQE